MHQINLKTVDLNLLGVLDALLETRNVTRAAETVGLSQPAVSHALARLRILFQDPLLVRVGRNMVPTRRATELQNSVRVILGDVRRLVSPVAFDPAATEGRFRINTPDATSAVVLSKVLNRISRQAPRLDFVITNAAVGRFDAMSRGEIDLAIDAFDSLPAGFHREKLLRDRLVCVARSGHAIAGRGLDAAGYAFWPHVNLDTASSRMLDRVLAENGIARRSAITVSNFITAAFIVAETDWLLTLPSNLAKHVQQMLPLTILELPFAAPEPTLDQIWHEVVHREPRHVWLRQQIRTVIREHFAFDLRPAADRSGTLRKAPRRRPRDRLDIAPGRLSRAAKSGAE